MCKKNMLIFFNIWIFFYIFAVKIAVIEHI